MFKRKKNRKLPEVSTSSLPDIIFMLLFFFMVVTVLKSHSSKVPIAIPATENPAKINHEATEHQLFVGHAASLEQRVQLDDRMVGVDQLEEILMQMALGKSDREKLDIPFYLRVDKAVSMGLITQVKTALRKSGFRKIHYVVLSQ